MLYNIDINKMNKLMSNNEDARQIIPQLLRNHRNTISTISHEIRNPLTLVSSALQVMEKQNPELKDIPHWSQVMGDVDFIIQLLEELSAFNSSNELYYSVFSIEQLLKNVAISFAISLDTNEADIEFSSSISDSLGEFTGDKIKLQELVLMECIFQPFVTYKPGGTGLGLAFSRKIAEAHEGTLTAVSTPQESTTFTVTLPV